VCTACATQLRTHFLKVHTFEIDLSDFPFSPRRKEKLRVEFLDPFGVALLHVLDTTLSGSLCPCLRTGTHPVPDAVCAMLSMWVWRGR
jgi:hypothetical protein